ncbi:hypothetical protein [Dyadobacter psychrotolerans]|uniref:Uncharacterized protein n=1 Tax=Dyadobacter psychrotolerans TaxID=2541721 RepID=A0A4R5DAW0_9BACT|nr:hypothetical protein [Dyadobacter psychrotolerans]TDE10806.1 hypothetical protein E0F88_27420 [Dyadobacter psychrotolerans]
MAENIYISKEVPLLEADIFQGANAENPGVHTRLRKLQNIIAQTSHIHYQADPLVPMSSAEYHHLYVQDYLTLIEANIYEKVSQNRNARFILLHYDFVYNQFFTVVSKYPYNTEPGLVVDTIIELVYEYYADGLAIDFSRNQDRYGAALHGVFSEQDEILGFYEAVRELYEGDSGKYLEVVGKF